MIEYQKIFVAEALELLCKLEKDLLLLEKKPDDMALIEDIFRGLHTIKGSSGMYGFEKIGKLTHLIENLFEKIREKELNAECNLISLTLKVIDFISKVLRTGNDLAPEHENDHQHIIEQIEIATNCKLKSVSFINDDKPDTAIQSTYFITFSVNSEFESRGVKLNSIFKQLEELGSVISIPYKNDDQTRWEIFLVCNANMIDIEDLFILMLDIVTIKKLASENLFLNDSFNALIKRNSTFKKPNDFAELQFVISSKDNFENKLHEPTNQKPTSTTTSSFLRVAAEKLDEQMDLLSELVTAKAELRLVVERGEYSKLNKLVESFDKVTSKFRKNILNVRLVQVKNWYVMFLRLVRDLSKQLNKNVEFLAEGLETEIDKNIIDSLEGPLTHLIRNCLDHGIETPEERKRLNKPEKGSILLKASHSGSSIVIEITDDGRGINNENVRSKAIAKGLIEKEDELSEKQLYDLLFLPGFSTNDKVSEVSGRGVGMDVVKKAVNFLRGEIEIQSKEGKGTSIIIKLPMMLSIIDTLLIRSGNQYFAISLPEVNKCTQLNTKTLAETENDLIQVDGELIPYINLRQIFGVVGDLPERQKLVIIENSGIRFCIIIDEVVGEYQAVLKPFDGYYINKQYFIGASLMADGHLCIILDTSKLLHQMINKSI